MSSKPNPSALHALIDQCETDSKKVKTLAKRVRILTQQRDQANARNAELRGRLAQYAQRIADAERKSDGL